MIVVLRTRSVLISLMHFVTNYNTDSYTNNNKQFVDQDFPENSEYGATSSYFPHRTQQLQDTAPTSASPSGYLGQCIAQYDYDAQADDELTIVPGDIIYILEKDDPGWWKGKLNNKVGVFPATYVTETDA